MEWLHTEEDEMRDVGFRREMYEADYIREHVREMPEMDVSKAVLEIKRYCDEQPNCTDCLFRNDPCIGNLPMEFRRIKAKMDEKKNNG